MKKSGFTLIELLVVVAIIAILAAIALPAFTTVMERSRAMNCSSNMRQIGLATAQYLTDNDDTLFVKTSTSSWAVALSGTSGTRYISTWKVFRSPFDKRADSESGTTSPVSYGINGNIMNGNASKSNAAWASGDFSYPSQLILLAPFPTTGVDPIVFAGKASDTSGGTTLTVPSSPVAKRGTWSSRRKIGVLYADYHVDPGLAWSDPSTPAAAGPFYCDAASTATAGGGLRRWVPDTP